MKFHHLARRAQSIAAAVVLAVGTFTGVSPAHAADSCEHAQLRISQDFDANSPRPTRIHAAAARALGRGPADLTGWAIS
ncbi:hypothetical protein ACIHEI_29975 [Kitasatospora sp. NPDC051984]|uniref:hypothetical protein n=1 Tax=Kitasatospora sp. NPDC051984 TaxID=3364059 RepID=UPI0037C56A4D